jgi:hypothetical protein
MVASSLYVLALGASALWFTAALRYFGFQHFAAAKVMVAKSQRHSPVFPTMAAGIRFLGGMNGSLALLCWALLFIYVLRLDLFTDPLERGVILVALAAAHFSQFAPNVPIHRNGGRQADDSLWDVANGPMNFIYVMDAAQMVLAFVAATLLFLF